MMLDVLSKIGDTMDGLEITSVIVLIITVPLIIVGLIKRKKNKK